MSVDVCELFNDLKSSEGLAGIVSKESSRLNHRFLPQAPGLDLSSNEGEKISKKIFSDDLKFTVDVNLSDSKKAFQMLISGLGDTQNFQELWSLTDHNPRAFPNPIGDVDLSALRLHDSKTATLEKGGEKK